MTALSAVRVSSSAPTHEAETRVCWVVVNLVHYHHARMAALARRPGLAVCVVELTDRDSVAELECHPTGPATYVRKTLFPGAGLAAIRSSGLRRRLAACLDEADPGVVCLSGWSLPGALESLTWCLRTGKPAVLISDSTAHDHPRTAWKEVVKRRIVRLCSAGFTAGLGQARYLEQLGMPPERIHTGYAVVDNEHFRRGAEEARQQKAEWRDLLGLPGCYFLACSRFGKVKNLPRLLRAFAHYRRMAGPVPWSLVILGDGELRKELLALRQQLGLEEALLFPGFKGYAELPVYYGLASVFVLASTSETWGLVVNEAMAAGLPVLVSERCGCAPDLVENGRNGFTFNPYDVEGLASLMLKVAGDGCDRQAMGQASRERIAHWGPEAFADGLSKAVETALSVPRPAPSLADRALLWALMRRRVTR